MVEKRRLDQLKECNNLNIPLDQMQDQFCVRCIRPDCTRSTFGTTKFDKRVQNWLERLVTNVPVMDPSDPRYFGIKEAKFSMVQPSLGSLTSSTSWDAPVDPEAGATPSPITEVVSPTTSTVAAPQGFQGETRISSLSQDELSLMAERAAKFESEIEGDVTTGRPVRSDPKVAIRTSSDIPRDQVLLNTPAQPGRMLQGGVPLTKPGPPVKKDQWAPPQDAGAPIVKPGAKIKLGGG